MYQKLANSPDTLSDHEILEILLFPYIPRKNTNDIAHRLIRRFGSLYNVLQATEKELVSVEGVGKKMASGIILNGHLVKRLISLKKPSRNIMFNLQSTLDEVKDLFTDFTSEKSALLFLDDKYAVVNKLTYQGNMFTHVDINLPEIVNVIALHKPRFVILAHSHTSNSSEPSKDDDTTTIKLHQLLSIHGVELIDHIILCKSSNYSYRYQDRLSLLKQKFNVDKYLTDIQF